MISVDLPVQQRPPLQAIFSVHLLIRSFCALMYTRYKYRERMSTLIK